MDDYTVFDQQLEETKTIPHSRQAEEALIGSLLINPEIAKKITISQEDFYIIRNSWIYQAIIVLSKNKDAIDIITVSDYLESMGQLEEVGGQAYLLKLINGTPSSMHYDKYSDIVIDTARRRRVLTTANELAQGVYDTGIDINTTISTAITGLANNAVVKGGATPISEHVSRVYDEIEERFNNPCKIGEVSGIPTGFMDFDRATDGMQPGEELILSAIPGLGKSLLLAQIGSNMSDHYPGAMYQLEMKASTVIKRLLSGKSLISTRDMKRGTIGDWNAFTMAVEELSLKPIYLSDETRMTTISLRADLTRLKELSGIKWFILDYLRLLKDRYGKDDTERTSFLSAELHDICKDLNLSGLVIHSMNKAGVKENGGNQADLSGSVNVIYDADQIVFMEQDKTIENLYTLRWAKFRDDVFPSNGVQIVKLEGYPAFKDYANYNNSHDNPRDTYTDK